MLRISAEFELRKRYALGERNFQSSLLRKTELKGINLSHGNFRGADLSSANLRGANLSNCDLSECCLNETDLSGANLSGANLSGASLVKAFLSDANLEGANLENAYLTGAFLTNANLKHVCLDGAYINGAELTGASLEGAHYNDKTHLPKHFETITAKMQKKPELTIVKITIKDLLFTLHNLTECSNHYLGSTLTLKYLTSSRPDFEWLTKFNISHQPIKYAGKETDIVTTSQQKYYEQWMKSFIKNCSMIIQDFPNIVEEKQLSTNFKKLW